ncbi:MAG: maltose alpha-D-glucosyltransferase, partial [Polyangiaceae bacterium]
MRRKASRAIGDELHWYRDAIIYEARVRSFYDKNGDGIGDFQGLADKLGYLQDLGVTAIWLLPFYPSPLKDDGYDISDYTDVHPDVGTLADFKVFLDEAHRRGLRVITELVLNHTSDQHAWFQRARLAAPGTPERDFYVWSDTPERYTDARIIFKDFEPSNWSWDPKAKAYFWHRFYAHQPDLNFENPAVHQALLEVVDQWFELGIDGLRLDAVPYLYEEEGSNCENLPRTHAFLRTLRAHVDKRFANRLLLAEANQWPEDAVAYFGAGDECHMCFHFPIMPRLFMSIHMEDRFPIIDILAQTPAIPEGCQWAIFLRNHDELTLEMVTDEERDYMYSAYAHEQTMRINLGIRRRLAPLVGSDRRKLELMNGLLFSLPGTPVLYYGDEIGMGDNHYLGDRNGVRTPMQWSADRNAGFSMANPQRLILPIIIDPDYHYESINVEAQQNNPSSLLWWTKRLIALRKRYKAFGRGSFEVLFPQNSSVLAFVRGHGDEAILVVANLSRHAQYVQLDLSRWKGQTPVELSGRTRFPAIEDAPYLLTLGGHAFYWMSIEPPKHAVTVESWQPPTIEVAAWEPALGEDGRGLLEELLPSWLPTRPWFRAAGRIIAKAAVVETAPITGGAVAVELVVAEVTFTNGESARYLVPVGLAPGERAGEVLMRSPHAVMAMVRVAPEGPDTLGETGARRSAPDAGALLYDATLDPPSAAPLLHAFAERLQWRGKAAEFAATLTGSLPPLLADAPAPRVERADSQRPAIIFGDTMVLKVQRQLDEGTSQDLEIKRFFSEHVPDAQPAALLGALEQRAIGARGPAVTLATLERFVPNEGDAWGHARAEVSRYFERVLASGEPAPPLPPGAGAADL